MLPTYFKNNNQESIEKPILPNRLISAGFSQQDLEIATPLKGGGPEGKTLQLLFDGYTISGVGDPSLNIHAFSGPQEENARESDKNVGPIPQGKYLINPQDIEVMETSDDWGNYRVRLSPYKLTIDRMKESFHLIRTSMYIHGGSSRRSFGGIQISDRHLEQEFFRQIKGYGELIELEVRYKGDRKRKYEDPTAPYNPQFLKTRLSIGHVEMRSLPLLRRILLESSQGEDVKALQQSLGDRGYPIYDRTGYFERDTREAVIGFQQRAGLAIDGKVGGETWGALGGEHEISQGQPGDVDNYLAFEIAKIAQQEAQKGLAWNGPQSEAEKYLRLLRPTLREMNHMDDYPVYYDWGAAFVMWCCRKAGYPVPDRPAGFWATMAVTDAWQFWAQQKGFWHGAQEFTPQRGDLVLFEWSGTSASAQQLGIVSSFTPGSSIINTYEGNVANRVGAFARSRANVVGYIRLR